MIQYKRSGSLNSRVNFDSKANKQVVIVEDDEQVTIIKKRHSGSKKRHDSSLANKEKDKLMAAKNRLMNNEKIEASDQTRDAVNRWRRLKTHLYSLPDDNKKRSLS